jgi:hypothetical protein
MHYPAYRFGNANEKYVESATQIVIPICKVKLRKMFNAGFAIKLTQETVLQLWLRKMSFYELLLALLQKLPKVRVQNLIG